MQVEYTFDPYNPNSFQYSLTNLDQITTTNLDQAMRKAAKLTKQKIESLGLKKVAICLSGMDGELILHYLINEGVHVECWTNNIEGIEPDMLIKTLAVCQKYNVSHHIINISTNELLNSDILFEINEKCFAKHYPYVTHPIAIKNIPDDYYIILGNGTLERTSPKYERIIVLNLDKDFDLKNNYYIPIDGYSQVVMELALKAYNKQGDSLWYSSCWDLWYHTLKHHALHTNGFSYYDDSHVRNDSFRHLNCLFSERTISRYSLGGAKLLFRINKLFENHPNSPFKTSMRQLNQVNGGYVTISKDLLK